ncbi:hypothetical protein F4821DRAFT_280208 [Hypoxylon rubiginosum]|uniref:Uncharacterized protein n=1 Tax=Hypoxylon rubiginosum TaxID=110542 RepID=A0ACC0DGK5_9PEZI|nr:hypothetical protein F4821DRAFT_280208 [Hypoxylon rubiginosum]
MERQQPSSARIAFNKRRLDRKNARIAQGLCQEDGCGKPIDEKSTRLCTYHLEIARESAAGYRERNRNNKDTSHNHSSRSHAKSSHAPSSSKKSQSKAPKLGQDTQKHGSTSQGDDQSSPPPQHPGYMDTVMGHSSPPPLHPGYMDTVMGHSSNAQEHSHSSRHHAKSSREHSYIAYPPNYGESSRDPGYYQIAQEREHTSQGYNYYSRGHDHDSRGYSDGLGRHGRNSGGHGHSAQSDYRNP